MSPEFANQAFIYSKFSKVLALLALGLTLFKAMPALPSWITDYFRY